MKNIYKYINLKSNAPEYPEGFQVVNKYEFYHEAADPITIYRDKGNSIAPEFSEDKWVIDGIALHIGKIQHTQSVKKYNEYIQHPDSNNNFSISLDQLLDLFLF